MPSFESFFYCCSHLFISFLYLYQGTAQICNKWVPGKHLVSMCDLTEMGAESLDLGERSLPVGPHFWKAVLAQEFNQSGCHHGCASAW